MRYKIFVITVLVAVLGVVVYELVNLQRRYLTPKIVKVKEAVVERIAVPTSPIELRQAAERAEIPFVAEGDVFKVKLLERTVSGEPRVRYKKIFVKAINLGPALPGTYPAEFAPRREDYLRWFQLIADAGFNAIRVYTVFPPEFYEALREYNFKNASRPLYLLQGVWATIPPDSNYFGEEYTAQFDFNIKKAVDAVHGKSPYFADVSQYTLGYILGREWEPYLVHANDKLNHNITSFEGTFFSIPHGTPTEVWLTQRMEFLMAYETITYGTQRPVSFINWLPLDPLYHNTEFIESPHVREYDNDLVSVDFTHIYRTPWNRAGFFAAYNVYPYYPDFINHEYNDYRSRFGPDNFAGYIHVLKNIHQGMPLFIAEFGVPSSRGIAHFNPYGMHHGGHTEEEQGMIAYRLFQDIYDEGCAGGALFEWLDEWFKCNWLFIDFETPITRNPLWHNVYDAEQAYGLMAFGAQVVKIDGEPTDWPKRPLAQKATGIIRSLYVTYDSEYFYVLVEISRPINFDRENMLIAIDTYDDELGDKRLPLGDGHYLTATNGTEFIVLLDTPESAKVLADTGYNILWGDITGARTSMRPSRNMDGKFDEPQFTVHRIRVSLLGDTFPQKKFYPGRLIYGKSIENSLAEWYGATRYVELRLPWNLLNVTDPSSHRILFDDPSTPELDVIETHGFAFSVILYNDDGELLDVLPGIKHDTVVKFTGRYLWDGWEQPLYRERLKTSYYVLKDKLSQVGTDTTRRHAALTRFTYPKEFQCRIVRFPFGKKGAISISFDGGTLNQFQYALPILERYRLKATFGVVGAWLNDMPTIHVSADGIALTRMGVDEVRTLSQYGHEIASFEWRPESILYNLPEDTIYFYLIESKSKLEEAIKHPVVTLQLPCSRKIPKLLSAAKRCNFAWVRLYGDTTNEPDGFDPLSLYSFVIYSQYKPTPKDIWQLLEGCADKWIIFVFHNILPEGSPEMRSILAYDVDPTHVVTPWELQRRIRLLRNSGFYIGTIDEVASYLQAVEHAKLKTRKVGDTYFITIETSDRWRDIPIFVKINGSTGFLRIEGEDGEFIYELRGTPIWLKVKPYSELIIHTLSE